ncbi:hypothetical protein [Bifidobacterium cebidarum]|uniref:DUF3168 domain-containing protein n=1 Tax=Bifidobacterium cebidarum TaxID=2650773 RepID=A0A6I1GN25_9BIFI|nr:hypothetical protein [Bifidobacterium cebidarum]KAB7789458.1 hypothetical protein F7D08_0410 [Bifidobacterium cebidarum]
MSSLIVEQRDRLAMRLRETLGGMAAVVTDDAQKARPQADRIAVLIEWPDIDYPTWGNDPETTWRVDLIAGTMATQARSLETIGKALDLIAGTDLCVIQARAVTFTLSGVGDLSAYQLTINPSDL